MRSMSPRRALTATVIAVTAAVSCLAVGGPADGAVRPARPGSHLTPTGSQAR
jgi:hypothetical protein